MNSDNVMQTQAYRLGTSNTDAIVDALQTLGRDQWHSRKAIAAQLGKVRLNPYDKAALSLLVEAGRIEVRQTPTRKPTTSRLEYRAAPEGTA